MYDLVIVGAGVSGAAQFFVAGKYSNINKVLLLDKEASSGCVNSLATSNSQTLHEGDIETNYTIEKAIVAKEKAWFTRAYVEKKDNDDLSINGPKMVFGVGKDEYAFLSKRYEDFKYTFPTLERLEGEELKKREPKMFVGRSKDQQTIALYNKDGLTINYSKLAKELVQDGKSEFMQDKTRSGEVLFNVKVNTIEKKGDIYELTMGTEVVKTRFVSFCAGSHSMYFAKKMKIKEVEHLSLLSIAGNFYHTPKYVNAKVYTVQNPKFPFSAVHADPDILYPDKNRFGPTTKIVLMLERHKYETVSEYFSTLSPLFETIFAYFRILFDRKFFLYAFRHNVLFMIPLLGNYLYLKEVRKIVPCAKYKELVRTKNTGGVRPVIIRTNQKNPLNLGEAKLRSGNVMFNVTPSPGATTCLYNGLVDIQTITETLGASFDTEAIQCDFGQSLTRL